MNNVFIEDFNDNIMRYLNNDFGTLKKLSESSKLCNSLVKKKLISICYLKTKLIITIVIWLNHI